MRAFIIALAVVLVPLAAASSRSGRCTENASCPSGSECVDNYCAVCSADASRCIRSVDRCRTLNCASDEKCYVSETPNSDGTVTLKLACGKSDPCQGTTCQTDEHCEDLFVGQQPPVALCRPNSPVNACGNSNCPSGSRCIPRVGFCGILPCLVEGVCVDLNDCESCNYFYQYCDVKVTDNNNVRGSCVNFMQPFLPPWSPWGRGY